MVKKKYKKEEILCVAA